MTEMVVTGWWRDGSFPLSYLNDRYNVHHRDKREDLEKCGHQRLYGPGELLYSRKGFAPRDDAIILIQRGRAKETINTFEGRQLIWSICHPGDLIGIVEYLGFLGRGSDVSALTEVQAVVISSQAFEKFLECHPGLWKDLARGMAREVAAAQKRLVEMAFDNAEPRLARILLDLIHPSYLHDEGGSVTIPLTQSDLASLLGTRRETVERRLQEWRARNIISTKSRAITVLQAETLAQIAGTSISKLRSDWELDGDGGCSHPSHRLPTDTSLRSAEVAPARRPHA